MCAGQRARCSDARNCMASQRWKVVIVDGEAVGPALTSAAMIFARLCAPLSNACKRCLLLSFAALPPPHLWQRVIPCARRAARPTLSTPRPWPPPSSGLNAPSCSVAPPASAAPMTSFGR
jgi:hypothetical protein